MSFKEKLNNIIDSYCPSTHERRLKLAAILDQGPLTCCEGINELFKVASIIGRYEKPEIDENEALIFKGILSQFRAEGGVFMSSNAALSIDFPEESFISFINDLSEIEKAHLLFSSAGYVLISPEGFTLHAPLQTYFNSGLSAKQRAIEFHYARLSAGSSLRLVDGCGKKKNNEIEKRIVQQVFKVSDKATFELNSIQILDQQVEYRLNRHAIVDGSFILSECVLAAKSITISEETTPQSTCSPWNGLFIDVSGGTKLFSPRAEESNTTVFDSGKDRADFAEFKKALSIDRIQACLGSTPFEYLIDIMDVIEQM